MIGRFSLRQINAMPTLWQGQYDDLKYDDGEVRVWQSRMRTEDGQPYDDQVTVERLTGGRWVTIDTYDPRSVGTGVFAAESVPWERYTYGVLPPLRDFEARLRNAKDEEGARLIGDPGRVYWMSLVDDDEIEAVRRIAPRLGREIRTGPDRVYPHKTAVEISSVRALHKLIAGLVQQWERGNEAAGSLASSIIYTLRYEWV